MADQVEKRVVEVLGRIDQNFAKQLNEINRQLGIMRNQVKSIQDLGTNLLQGIIGAGTLRTLQQAVDTQTQLRRGLEAVAPIYTDIAQTQEDLFEISLKTQRSFEDTSVLFNKLEIAAGGLGSSQKTLTDVTTAFNLAVLQSGAGLREAAAGSLQFGQALASGRLQGDEFRSIMENIPVLAVILAKNFKTATGEIGITIDELRELSRAGELTTPAIFDALTRGLAELEDKTGDLPRTIGSSVLAVTEAFGVLAGKADLLLGISEKVEAAFVPLAEVIAKLDEKFIIAAGLGGIGLFLLALTSLTTVFVSYTAAALSAALATSALAKAFTFGVPIVGVLAAGLAALLGHLDALAVKDLDIDKILGTKNLQQAQDNLTRLQERFDQLVKLREEALKAAVEPTTRPQQRGTLGRRGGEEAFSETQRKQAERYGEMIVELQPRLLAAASTADKLATSVRDVNAVLAEAKNPELLFERLTKAIDESILSTQRQYAALIQSVDAYDAVVLSQKVAVEQQKALDKAIEDGLVASDEFKRRLFEKVEFQVRFEEQLKKELAARKALESFQETAKGAEKEVRLAEQRIAALRDGVPAYEDLKQSQEGVAQATEDINKAQEAGARISGEAVVAHYRNIEALELLAAAEDQLKRSIEGRANLARQAAEQEREIANLKDRADAAILGADALEKENQRIQVQTSIRQQLNEAKENDVRLSRDEIAGIIERTNALAEQQRIAKEKTAVGEGREQFGTGVDELKDQVTQSKELVEAARQGEGALKKKRAEHDAINQAQALSNQLDKDDIDFKDKQRQIVTDLNRQLEKNKLTVDAIIDAQKKAEADRERERKKKEAADAKAIRDKEALEERQRRFIEGPDAVTFKALEDAQSELNALMKGGTEEAKKAANASEDLQKFLTLEQQAKKADIPITDEWIAKRKEAIATTRELTDAIAKEEEQIKLREDVMERIDPNKELRKERDAITAGLDRGSQVFVTDAAKQEAVQRLEEIAFAMSGIKRVADELATMNNPFASLVNAAAETSRVFSDEFARMSPVDQITTGATAAQAVLVGLSDTMKLLGVENFELQKGLAIAQATVNAALAITKVLADGGAFALPLVGLIAGITGAQIAAIAASQPPQRALGGPVIPKNIYRVGEQGPEMFRSQSGKNYLIPGEGGNVTANNKLGGNVIIHNYSNSNVTAEQDDSGNTVVMVNAAVKAVRKDFDQQMATGYGTYPSAIRRNVAAGRKVG